VGADFSSLPGISAFGAFARVVRLNHISPKGYFSAFGLRNRRDEDLSLRLTFSETSRNKVAEALSLTPAAALDPVIWLPFQGGSSCMEASWSFRYCPACLRQGFHTLLHQLPWVCRCPWHRMRLLTKCAICGSSLTLRARPGHQLLTCSNGHDIFNEMVSCADPFDQAANAAAFIERYLTWAERERAQSLLIPPEAATKTFDVMRNTVALPRPLLDCCRGPESALPTNHTRTLKRQAMRTNGVHDLPSALAKLSSLRHEKAGLELPPQMSPDFLNIGCQLANRLPPESLTDSEMSLFFDGLTRQPDRAFKPARRSPLAEIRFLPPLLIGETRVIHRSTLSKTASWSAERLLAVFMDESMPPDPQADSSQQLVLCALESILKRAYAEGMRIVLSRYIPTLFDSKRDRPRLTEPWVLVRKEGHQLNSIKIVWAKRRWLS
jgi:hypothetical protein